MYLMWCAHHMGGCVSRGVWAVLVCCLQHRQQAGVGCGASCCAGAGGDDRNATHSRPALQAAPHHTYCCWLFSKDEVQPGTHLGRTLCCRPARPSPLHTPNINT